MGIKSSIVAATLSVVLLVGSSVQADVAPVSDDGYLPVNMGNWYWSTEYAKSYNNLFGMGYYCYGFARFDLTPLTDAGITGDDVDSAVFRFYLTGKQGAGPNPYPDGTEGTFTVNAYDDSLMLDETYVGSDRPGYVTDTTVEETYDGGPDTWASVDITDIVKGWLNGDYVNNGIEVYDGLEDDYGWYWSTKEAGNRPYLDVTIPEPVTMTLLVCGSAGLLMRRRSQIRRGKRRAG
ncbi:MAG: DNRLRE domain-containing protein [Phycisphaerae bacterium]|nr:DNRLRE domain-containing protein [Phycisphaerae bacterium]